jgi:hypothetical protein
LMGLYEDRVHMIDICLLQKGSAATEIGI